MADCQCPSPPGGVARCDPGQLAICRVRNGVVETRCLTPTRAAKLSRRAMDIWVLEQVTGQPRKRSRLIRADELQILRSGSYEAPDGTRVRFALPEDDTDRGAGKINIDIPPFIGDSPTTIRKREELTR